MARVYEAPSVIPWHDTLRPVLFLSGAIDQGKAEEWQQRAIGELGDLPITILNPRRLDWDNTWVQRGTHTQFREQVIWELEGLERSNVVLVHFPSTASAPISLLELGLVVKRGTIVIVACALDYWRRGNVELVCERYEIALADDLSTALEQVRRAITE